MVTSGDVSGSSTSTGSFGRLESSKARVEDKLEVFQKMSIFGGHSSNIENTAALSIYSDNKTAIHIDHDDYDTPAVYIDTTNSGDKALEIYSNAAATANPLVSVIAENASMDNELIHLRQDGNNGAITITNNGTGDGIVYTGGQHAISGSSTSTGSFGKILQNGQEIAIGQSVGTTDDVTFGSVTTTGNISGSATSTGSFGHVKIPNGNIDIMTGNANTRVGIGKLNTNMFYIGANPSGSAGSGGNVGVKVGTVDSGGNVRKHWTFTSDGHFKSQVQNLGSITMGGSTFKMDSTYNDVKIQMGYDTVPFVLNKPIYNLADVEFIQDEKKNIKFFEDAQTGGEIMQLYRGGINISGSGNISGSSTSTIFLLLKMIILLMYRQMDLLDSEELMLTMK